jgi:hypothetical protein
MFTEQSTYTLILALMVNGNGNMLWKISGRGSLADLLCLPPVSPTLPRLGVARHTPAHL